MSSNKPAKKARPIQAAPAAPKPHKQAAAAKGDPFLSLPLLWLGVAAFAVYLPSLFFKITELDDSIFIQDFHQYNEDLGNLFTSFTRGLFDAIKDPYYRPLFMDSMILNYHISDSGHNIAIYHLVNVLLHAANVLLLYRLFMRLKIRKSAAFVMTLIFAVHPVLSQAVAWIPGRNDTLLALFALSFFNRAIDYCNTGRLSALLLSALFLLLAFFTKETAVFVPPAAFVLLVFLQKRDWRGKRLLIQFGAWAACFVFWFAVRAWATPQSAGISPGKVVTDFLGRMPLIIQYLGKIFLPFNLSVFPTQEDTTIVYGLVAVALLAAGLFLNKQRDLRVIVCGFGIFLLFLLPALLVPNDLNGQTFEHRLYLPIIGILLLLPQTVVFAATAPDRKVLLTGVAVSALLAAINIYHQPSFATPAAFWKQAAETSPNSAYANMMLAARTDDMPTAYALFRKAYRINPKEKYLNYYYGVMLQREDSILASEKYLLEEKNTSGYYECDFYLARAAMERKDLPAAIGYLRTYVTHDVYNKVANSNLLLMYLDTHQTDSARAQVAHMRGLGMDVPPQVAAQLGM